jgi:hypothetical protein
MSRPKRWAKAIEALREQVDVSAIEELKEEYEDWLGNLPENLEQSPTAEKLEATIEAAETIMDAASELVAALEEAEGVELPLGFGRD